MPNSLAMLLPPALGSSPHPPVSVYGTGPWHTIAAFPGTHSWHFATLKFAPLHASAFAQGFSPPVQLLRLHRSFLSRHAFCACVPTFLVPRGTGISTCYPSATLYSLALGPDLPREDKLYPGNLRYSANRIPTCFSLLIPAFSLHAPPLLLTVQLRRSMDAPLPHRLSLSQPVSTASVLCFSPGHFRRRDSRLVSCYALFECMAASEPTS